MGEVYSSNKTCSSPYIFWGTRWSEFLELLISQKYSPGQWGPRPWLPCLKSECDLASSVIKHWNNKARRIWPVSDSQRFWVSNSQLHSEKKKNLKNQAKAEARCCFLASSLAKVTAPLPPPQCLSLCNSFVCARLQELKPHFKGYD